MKMNIKKFLLTLYIILIMSASAIAILANSKNKQGLIEIFGYNPLNITATHSKLQIKKNDLLILKKQPTYYQGDIISYISIINSKPVIKVDTIKTTIKLATNKQIFTLTHDNENIDSSCIIGKPTVIFPKIGPVLDFLITPDGFFLIFVTPSLVIFIYLFHQFITSLTPKYKK